MITFLVIVLLLGGIGSASKIKQTNAKLHKVEVEKYTAEYKLKECEGRKQKSKEIIKLVPAPKITSEELDAIKKQALEETENEYKKRIQNAK